MSINASMAQHLLDRGLLLPVDGNYATAELKGYAERLHALYSERTVIETRITKLAIAEDKNDEQTQRKASSREHAEQEHGGSDRHGVGG